MQLEGWSWLKKHQYSTVLLLTLSAKRQQSSSGMMGGSGPSETLLHSGQEESSQEYFSADSTWACPSSDLVTALIPNFYHGRIETVIKAASQEVI